MKNKDSIKICVSGSAKFMPKDVEEGFVELLNKYCENNSGQSIIQAM